MDLTPGSRWRSQVCGGEVVIVRPPNAPLNLECGGHVMIAASLERTQTLSLSPSFAAGVVTGKRYVDAATGFECLCIKPGEGSLTLDGRALTIREAKSLPSSD